MNSDERRIEINAESDVAHAVYQAHDLTASVGFRKTDQFMVATSVSELARNVALHAGSGVMTLRTITEEGRIGVEVVTEDEGPGISDINQALTEGYSTIGTLGLGLPGVKRLMDNFSFDAERVSGTRIAVRKWCR